MVLLTFKKLVMIKKALGRKKIERKFTYIKVLKNSFYQPTLYCGNLWKQCIVMLSDTLFCLCAPVSASVADFIAL